MHVVHFILDPRFGGPHQYVKTIAGQLRGKVECMIVTAGRGPVTDIALVNLRHHWYPLYLLEVPINVCYVIVLALLGRIPRGRSCIFNVHGAANIAPLIAAWVLRKPVVWHFHETMPWVRSLVRTGRFFIATLKHRLVTVAPEVAGVFALRDYTVLRPPIDTGFWQRDTDRPPGSGETLQFLDIVSIGNLNPIKGQDLLLAAAGGLQCGFRIRFVGAELANHAGYARKLAAEKERLCNDNPRAAIEFLGWQDAASIRSLLAHCDVLVLPSRTEACPIVLLEAMAMECVCVATDVGGVRGIIRSPAQGYVVRPESSEALAGAFGKVCSMTAAERKAMGQAARQRICEEFNMKRVAAQHLDLYQNLVTAP